MENKKRICIECGGKLKIFQQYYFCSPKCADKSMKKTFIPKKSNLSVSRYTRQ